MIYVNNYMYSIIQNFGGIEIDHRKIGGLRHTVVYCAAKFGCARHCYLHEPTFSHFQKFTAQKLLGQNHVLDVLQSHYLTYLIWKELAQWFPRYAVPKVTRISLHFSSSQHSLIHLKTTFSYFEFHQICTINYTI